MEREASAERLSADRNTGCVISAPVAWRQHRCDHRPSGFSSKTAARLREVLRTARNRICRVGNNSLEDKPARRLARRAAAPSSRRLRRRRSLCARRRADARGRHGVRHESARRACRTRRHFARIGEMDQATAVFDDDGSARLHDLQGTAHRRAACRRCRRTCSSGDPVDRRSAVLRSPRLRHPAHRGRGAGQRPHNRRAAQGGSTITQQLARQSFLTPDKTYPPQAAGADPRERGSSACTPRTQILELYLNKVYFGDGLYGVEAASRGYFGKHASELSACRRPRCSPGS